MKKKLCPRHLFLLRKCLHLLAFTFKAGTLANRDMLHGQQVCERATDRNINFIELACLVRNFGTLVSFLFSQYGPVIEILYYKWSLPINKCIKKW